MTTLGEWDLLEPIGVGAHAVVHRAVHRDRPGRVVAVKRLRDVSPDAVAALRNEAAVLADLDHPGIAVLHDVVPDGDGIALVLGLATGGSLAQRLERDGRLPPDEVADLGRRLGTALAAAHDAGVVHRDVTPANVLYGIEAEPRLADFGIAAARDVAPDEVAGTATYLDPEVARGAPPSPASDTWSLAVLLWEALAGQAPWLGGDDAAVRRAADRGDHLPLQDLAGDAPPALVEVLERGILRDPTQRFAHPQQLALALAGLGGGVGADDGATVATSVPAATATGTVARAVDARGVDGTAATDSRTGDDRPTDGDGSGTRRDDDVGDPGAPPDRLTPDDDPPPDEPGRTTVYGPRPPRSAAPATSRRPWWLTRPVVVVAAILPLLVAGWAVARSRDASASSARGAGGSPEAATAVEASTPPAVVVPTPAPSPTPTPSPTPSSTPSPSPTPSPSATPAPSPTPVVPAAWQPRTPPPLCDLDRRRPSPPPDTVTLLGDVDGRGCTRRILVVTDQVEGADRTILVVPDTTTGPAGRYDLGPVEDRVVVGDWNDDGTDTPAVVRAGTGDVFTFASWADQEGVASPDPPVPGTPVVLTDRGGRDHVVDEADLSGR